AYSAPSTKLFPPLGTVTAGGSSSSKCSSLKNYTLKTAPNERLPVGGLVTHRSRKIHRVTGTKAMKTGIRSSGNMMGSLSSSRRWSKNNTKVTLPVNGSSLAGNFYSKRLQPIYSRRGTRTAGKMPQKQRQFSSSSSAAPMPTGGAGADADSHAQQQEVELPTAATVPPLVLYQQQEAHVHEHDHEDHGDYILKTVS
ncbi:unnamed protein product, partial [Amoebophrya sp. A120]